MQDRSRAIPAQRAGSSRHVLHPGVSTKPDGELIPELATTLPVADIRIEEPTSESFSRLIYEGSLTFESAI